MYLYFPDPPRTCFSMATLFWKLLYIWHRGLAIYFFFFNRHCNPCGFCPVQLLLSILSRMVFTECRCERTSNPQLGGPVIRTFQLASPGVPHVWNDASEPKQRKVDLWARNCREFCQKWRLPRHFWGSFTCRKFTTWDRRLYFPSEGRRAEEFFARKIRRHRPGLKPRTWVPNASTLVSHPDTYSNNFSMYSLLITSIHSIILQSILRQVLSLYQRDFSTQRDLILPLSI